MFYILNLLSTTRGQWQPEQQLLRFDHPEVDVRMEVNRAKKSRRTESKDTGHQNIAGEGTSL